MTKYRIVEKMSGKLLEMSVNGLIEEGWKPQGGLQIAKDEHLGHYYQAMIKD
jgi:hypothetical protein